MTTRKERDEQAREDLAQLEGLGSGVMMDQAKRYGTRPEAWNETPTDAFRAGWVASRTQDVHDNLLRVHNDRASVAIAAEKAYERLQAAAPKHLTMPAWGALPESTREGRIQMVRAMLADLAAVDG